MAGDAGYETTVRDSTPKAERTKTKMKPRGHPLINGITNTTTTNNDHVSHKLLSSSGGRNNFNNINVMEAKARHEERVRQRASLPSPAMDVPPFPSYDPDSSDPRDLPLSAPRPGYHEHLHGQKGQTRYFHALPMEDVTPMSSSRATPRPHSHVEASEEEIRILAGYAESLRGKSMQSAPPPPNDDYGASIGSNYGPGGANGSVPVTVMVPSTNNTHNRSGAGGGNFGGIGSTRGKKGVRGGKYQRQKKN